MAAGDAVSEFELHAYMDDQLDMARRVEVEGYLADHPEIAAQVMADLRTRDALRLALATPLPHPRSQTLDAARRLERGLAMARFTQRLRRGVAAIALMVAGWFVHAQVAPLSVAESEASPRLPAYVEDAVLSHRTEMLRAGMRSQPMMSDFDPAEILAATHIAMPSLPGGWRVLDVQVFPSREGPSVEMAVEARDLGTLSLFAVRTTHRSFAEPAVLQVGAEHVAHWRTGHLAYALTGTASERDLLRAAHGLAGGLN